MVFKVLLWNGSLSLANVTFILVGAFFCFVFALPLIKYKFIKSFSWLKTAFLGPVNSHLKPSLIWPCKQHHLSLGWVHWGSAAIGRSRRGMWPWKPWCLRAALWMGHRKLQSWFHSTVPEVILLLLTGWHGEACYWEKDLPHLFEEQPCCPKRTPYPLKRVYPSLC